MDLFSNEAAALLLEALKRSTPAELEALRQLVEQARPQAVAGAEGSARAEGTSGAVTRSATAAVGGVVALDFVTAIDFAAAYVTPGEISIEAVRAASAPVGEALEKAKKIIPEPKDVVLVLLGVLLERGIASPPSVTSVVNVTQQNVSVVVPAELSPLARVVLRVLEVAPGTVLELAFETKLPAGVVDAALAELRNARRAAEVEPGRWRATP